MGALHEGHAALLRRAKETGRPVALSIFVNPTQFAPTEDLAQYPRTLDADLAIARAEGVDVVWVPAAATIYPEGISEANAVAARLALPDVATQPSLEDHFRPGHFAGVQLVVARLFDVVRPAVAFFGEKDWQQLKLVEAMVRIAEKSTPSRWPGLTIAPVATFRENDGLALSSRNRYLRPQDRSAAIGVVRAIRAAQSAAKVTGSPAAAERAMHEVLARTAADPPEGGEFTLDYAVVRDAASLLPMNEFTQPSRALIAARLSWPGGGVRLIDNAALLDR